MSKRKQVSAAVISHKGCERSNNEDNFFLNGDYLSIETIDAGVWIEQDFSDAIQLFAVCDGMGGAQSGERAATITVRSMVSLLVEADAMDVNARAEAFCRKASEDVYQDGNKRDASRQGCTLAMVLLKRNAAFVYNVGDSRVYLLRDQTIKQLTTDHSEVARMVQAGMITKEQARKHVRGNIITRFIGMPANELPSEFVEKNQVKLLRYDRLLLCTDGISDLLSDEQMLSISNASPSASTFASELSRKAMELSGKDNLTVIALDLKRGYTDKP